jgi:hypothetical protein
MADTATDRRNRARTAKERAKTGDVPPKESPLGADSPLLGGDRPKTRGDLGKIEANLNDLMGTMSMMFVMKGDAYCGMILAQRSPALVTSWIELAKVNDGVKRVLDTMSSGGAWSGVIMSTSAIAIPMAQHHGYYPQEWPNPWALDITPLDMGMNGQAPPADDPTSPAPDEDTTNPSGSAKSGKTKQPGPGSQ